MENAQKGELGPVTPKELHLPDDPELTDEELTEMREQLSKVANLPEHIEEALAERNPRPSASTNAAPTLQATDTVFSRSHDPAKDNGEMDDAIWFCRLSERSLRLVPQQKDWIVWSGGKWVRGEYHNPGLRCAQLLADQFSLLYLTESKLKTYDKETLKYYRGRHSQLKSIARAKRVAEGAASFVEMQISSERLDTHPTLLNCPNGVLDLEKGVLLPHDRKYYLTQMSSAPYDPEAKAPLWEEFIRQVTRGNEELADYLQRIAGYVAQGRVSERQFWVLYGIGKNGKSTFVNVLSGVLGRDYAMTTPFDTFTKRNQNNSELADIMGARLVVVEEGEENEKLQMRLLKSLVGGEGYQQVRRLYENPQTRPIRMKIVIATNHLPTFEDTSEGTRDRLRVIKFNARFEGKEKKLDKDKELLSESSGILNWIVEGHRKWREQGLDAPQMVEEATDKAMRTSDPFRAFFEDHCRRDPNGITLQKNIHAQYCKWSQDNDGKRMSSTKVRERLEAYDFEQIRYGPDGDNAFSGLICDYPL